jgi:ABC-2 type transport system ATP-binding protein
MSRTVANMPSCAGSRWSWDSATPCSGTCRPAVPLHTWTGLGEVSAVDGAVVTLLVPRAETAAIAARLLTTLPVEDVAIEDPPVEDIIRAVFADA